MLFTLQRNAKPSVDEPVLLVLESHFSSNLQLLQITPYSLAVITEPPDAATGRGFYGPLKAAYKKECDNFLKSFRRKIYPIRGCIPFK